MRSSQDWRWSESSKYRPSNPRRPLRVDGRSLRRTKDCLARIHKAAAVADELGLECHAGHGLTFDTVGAVAVIPTIAELNIGHFLIGEAIFSGLDSAIRRMRALMNKARAEAGGARSA